MNIHEKLLQIQHELKAPKNQRNSLGNYNYRSCEDILEGVKPLLLKHSLSMVISDDVVLIGDRFYVKAVVTLCNTEAPEEKLVSSALAREQLQKKGCDEPQITGGASSYARKYALNGMFAIDDSKLEQVKDPDSMKADEMTTTTKKTAPVKTVKTQPKTEKPFDRNKTIVGIGEWFEGKIDLFNDTMGKYGVGGLGELTDAQLQNLGKAIKEGKIK
ncbi:ERF family protein [Fusobacterium varium]|uniref:Recombinase n=1 Tax=Fusobacterium varium ATCC 27725 TaxID=469618 RepID=A0ABN5JJZ5_FUSVA|nr:ERF family protein [Fusobacterium varium]AVQ32624.1 recombinase [Fusobacterium varium ATCC 27725]EES63571.1 Erf family protein [Fusobacterium varium ATCC 27725]